MRIRVALVVLAALPSCSLFSSLDDLSENVVYVEAGADGTADGASPNDGGSGGGNDGGGGTDGSSPGEDAGGDAGYANLHPNGTFDVSCQGWYPYNATLASDTTAHSGAGSCRVCANITKSDVATIDENGAVTPVAIGGVYVASAWVRVPDGVTGPSSGVVIVLGTRAPNGSVVESQSGSYTAVDTTWKQIKVQLTVTMAAARLRVWAGEGAVNGTCFLIDDVRVERWQ